MKPVVLLPRAEVDLFDAAIWYENEREGLGPAFEADSEGDRVVGSWTMEGRRQANAGRFRRPGESSRPGARYPGVVLPRPGGLAGSPQADDCHGVISAQSRPGLVSRSIWIYKSSSFITSSSSIGCREEKTSTRPA